MALFLLQKTPLVGTEPITIDGQSVLGRYKTYEALVHIPASGQGLSLILAEPVFTAGMPPSPDTLSWYADTFNEPRALSALSSSEAEPLYQKIAQTFHTVLTAQPDKQAVLEHILTSPSLENIFITSTHVIVCGWGLRNTVQPEAHPFATSAIGTLLGTYFGSASNTSQASLQETAAPITASTTATEQSNTQTHASSLPPPSGLALTSGPSFLHQSYTLLILALFFLIGLLVGLRLIWAQQPTQILGLSLTEARQLIEKAPEIKKKNAILQKDIESLEEQLKHPTCDLHKDRAESGLNHLVPPQAAPLQKDGQPFGGSLPRLLNQSTVFVVGITPDGVVSGSGFFVTPDTILTNRHVVENVGQNGLFIASKTIGKLVPARVQALSPDAVIGNMDLAVLHVSNIAPQQFLVLTPTVEPLDDVVAAGYPGMLLKTDSNFLRLLKEGDVTAIPGVILTKGQINAIQTDPAGFQLMPHSATVSTGNSGGPLVDMCGRVVGINTFVTTEKETASHGNYAFKADAVIATLQKAHIPVTVKEESCRLDDMHKPAPENSQDKNSPPTQPDPSVTHQQKALQQ